MLVSMCFKIMSKVVKYTCRLRRYNYTHDQLNRSTRHFISIFRNFLRGGGAKFKFAPGARYPRYATESNMARKNKMVSCFQVVEILSAFYESYPVSIKNILNHDARLAGS